MRTLFDQTGIYQCRNCSSRRPLSMLNVSASPWIRCDCGEWMDVDARVNGRIGVTWDEETMDPHSQAGCPSD